MSARRQGPAVSGRDPLAAAKDAALDCVDATLTLLLEAPSLQLSDGGFMGCLERFCQSAETLAAAVGAAEESLLATSDGPVSWDRHTCPTAHHLVLRYASSLVTGFRLRVGPGGDGDPGYVAATCTALRRRAAAEVAFYPGGGDALGQKLRELAICVEIESARARAVPSNAAPPIPRGTTTTEERVLKALDGKALTADGLQRALGMDRKQLYRDGINPLKGRGYIANDRNYGGYYRPDAPPPRVREALARDRKLKRPPERPL
jgi:hypothetical protein